MIQGIYIITDETLVPGRTHVEIAEAAIEGGASIIQLRDKDASDAMLIPIACEIQRMASEAGVLFIVNDRLDVALAIDADGIHIGQGDRPAGEIRSLIGNKILGVSVSTPEEAIRAEADGADYLGVGPIFPTTTKLDVNPAAGLSHIYEIRSACNLPIVAIGGINGKNLAKVAKTPAESAAVISAVVCEEDMVEATRRLVRIWRENKA